jgi:hypothetical protein
MMMLSLYRMSDDKIELSANDFCSEIDNFRMKSRKQIAEIFLLKE